MTFTVQLRNARNVVIAAALAAAGAAVAIDAATPCASCTAAARSLLDTFVLLRWGGGALDWNLPDAKGNPDARIRSRGA